MTQKSIIGLTGGIGSGKSAAAKHFSNHGVSVVDADQASREVVKKGEPALSSISDYFGEEILNKDGSLDRSKLRVIVFKDEKKRKWLQSLMYPITNNWIIEAIEKSNSSYTILMNPLLIESRQYKWCTRIAVVDVSVETQIHRTMTRDANTREQVESIIAAQVDRTKRLQFADDVIDNDHSPKDLEEKIARLHKKYLKL